MAYSKTLDLLFIHVPKCGGTSIIESIKEKDPTVKHGHTKWNEHKDVLKDVGFSFGIVRNPWDRAFSCYNYARMDTSFWHGNGSKYGIHSEYELAKKMEFNDFVKFFYNNRAVMNYPPSIRPNFRHNWDRQLPYLYDINFKKKVDKIYNFEDFPIISDMLKEKYDLSVKKLNSSEKKEDYRSVYNDTSILMIYEIYSEDVDFFGYKF